LKHKRLKSKFITCRWNIYPDHVFIKKLISSVNIIVAIGIEILLHSIRLLHN